MSNSLMRSTQISVTIALTVVSRSTGDSSLAVIPLFHLTWLVMVLWRWQVTVNKVVFSLNRLEARINDRLEVAGKVLAIGFNTFSFVVLGV